MDPRRKALIALGAVIAVLGGVLFAVTRGGDDAPPPTTVVTTTTVPPTPWPLTGLPAPEGAPIGRAAIAVKVSNSTDARPQVGLDVADIVIEERVEGITRLIAIFHSTPSAPVGPGPPGARGPIRPARAPVVDPDHHRPRVRDHPRMAAACRTAMLGHE